MTAIATYSPTGNAYVDGVLSGVKWGVTSLTFSFPTDATVLRRELRRGEPQQLQGLHRRPAGRGARRR